MNGQNGEHLLSYLKQTLVFPLDLVKARSSNAAKNTSV